MPQMKRRTAMVGSALLLILATVSPVVAAPLAQEPYEVEVAQVDLSDYPRITLYVTVRDAEGRPVEGLGRSDFHILEGQGQARIEEFAGLGQQRPVDIVFVLDTTGSMGSHIQTIKETIISFAETLEGRHRDYRLGLVTYGDDVRESHTFTDEVALFSDWIEAQDADGGGNEPENALGGLQQAAGFPFRAEAQRLILLITDAPLHEYGDGPDSDVSFDDPLLTVEATAARLAAASVSVYGVTPGMSDYVNLAEQTGGQIYSIYDDLGQIVDNLGTAIANQYRITYRAPRAVFDGSWKNVQVTVGRTEGTASYRTPSERPPGASSVDLYNTLPTPLQISTDPAVVGTNLGLAILLALLFGLTSTIFNDTLNEHQDEIEHSLVGRFFSALKAIGGLLTRPFQALTFRGRRAGAYVQVVAFLVVTAFIACFLDPSYRPLSWAGLGLFSSMLLSIGLVNLVYEGSQITAARRFDLEAVLKLNPIGVAVAVGCVFFSRMVGFTPGYLYGVPGGYALGAAVDLSRRREVTIAGTGLGATTLLALLSWGLTAATALLQKSLGAAGFAGFVRGATSGLQSVLLTIFFVGLEVVFLELFPLGPTNGATIFEWNKVVWGLGFAVVSFLAFHTLFTPQSAYLDAVRSQSLPLLLAVLALYSALTVGLWLFFDLRGARQRSADLCASCGQQNLPDSRFCARCGAALLAPARGRVSRRGLVLAIAIGVLWLAIGVAVLLAALG